MSRRIAREIVENLLKQYNELSECIRSENNILSNYKPLDFETRINYNSGRIDQQLIMINDLKLVLKELYEC